MIFKTLVLFGLLNSAAASRLGQAAPSEVEANNLDQHLDLELEIEGERRLFPLLPGTKCPPGHVCRARAGINHAGVGPMANALKKSFKTQLSESLDWNEFNSNLNTIVASDDYCTRRGAMARAAGLAAGLSVAAVSTPAYAAETATVKMGTDSGGLQFVPAKTQICKGDSVKWINNKGGPHNVVFDEDAIPSGVKQEAISMYEDGDPYQLGEEGEEFVMKFDTAGTYEYYCEPHRGAGMNAVLTVV